MKTIRIRFYEELNDFLPDSKKKVAFSYNFINHPTIKNIIESLGIPHTEVDLILVNGKSVPFDYKVKENDNFTIYPVFESFDIARLTRLRPYPLRKTKFVLDVHLGKLARLLRLAGFDCLYNNNYTDPEIVNISLQQKRIILTRDIGILKRKTVTHGYWLRSRDPYLQVEEVIKRFDLYENIKPFKFCMSCNGKIYKVNKKKLINKIDEYIFQSYNNFYQCNQCHKIYWNGTHIPGMLEFINKLKNLKS